MTFIEIEELVVEVKSLELSDIDVADVARGLPLITCGIFISLYDRKYNTKVSHYV